MRCAVFCALHTSRFVLFSFHSPPTSLSLDFSESISTASVVKSNQSGSEAIEASVKIARHATGKQNIIVFRGGHHGRTLGTMGLTTSKISYRAGFGPLPSGGVITSYPYCARCLARPTPSGRAGGGECCNGPLMELEQLLHQASQPFTYNGFVPLTPPPRLAPSI